MNFINKAVKTVGNAIELDSLKTEREKLSKEKKELEGKLAKREQIMPLVTLIEAQVSANDAVIAQLIKIGATENFDFESAMTTTESAPDVSTPLELPDTLKSIYRRSKDTNKSLKDDMKMLEKITGVPAEDYQARITTLDNEIEKINVKLRKIRGKD